MAEPPLDRAAILAAAARAASAAALGRDDRTAQRELDGDRFEVRIRFGCPGGGSTGGRDAPFGIRYEPESRTLRLRALPDLTRQEGWIAALGGDSAEAVEGFWMRKPWLLEAGCPVVASESPAGSEPTPDEEEQVMPAEDARPAVPEPKPVETLRVGIAQFFSTNDPRTGRRDRRAYEATRTLKEGEAPSRQGYDLVLSGRLRDLPDGRVIACNAASPHAPPECVVSASFDQVRIERADTGQVLADWAS